MKLLFLSLLLSISSSLLSQANQQYRVTSNTLNVRSGPGKDFNPIGALSKDDIVTIVTIENPRWWKVEFNGIQGWVASEFLKLDDEIGWNKTNYYSGQTPNCENITPKYDYSINNYLTVNVGKNTDVVVKLMKRGTYQDECIRIVYVRSGEIYSMKNIPEGFYYLKIAYGKDWRQKIIDNQCVGKFNKASIYEKGTEILDFNKKKEPNEYIGNQVYENWSVPSFELELDVYTTSKYNIDEFKSSNISEADFNK
jgi:uncharacterized protein YraI